VSLDRHDLLHLHRANPDRLDYTFTTSGAERFQLTKGRGDIGRHEFADRSPSKHANDPSDILVDARSANLVADHCVADDDQLRGIEVGNKVMPKLRDEVPQRRLYAAHFARDLTILAIVAGCVIRVENGQLAD
jgi:hypothetical protein